MKKQALRDVFVTSHILLIYGAAGTGKTTLINYISNLMSNQRKLFLTKTHTAKQNLKRRIDNPGLSSEFISIDSFTKKVSLPDYDVIFVDECSTLDNRTMWEFLKKISPDTFLVLAGDIHQIESIDFGNWFFYAKDIINTQGSNVELLNTWRTQDADIINLWDEVRKRGSLITEKLAMDGPFSDNIGENIFKNKEEDEIVLCLNYDGKFGLNNMNNYFQNDNPSGDAISWQEWSYKIGDSILFNDSQRFTVLYNNLKGKIVKIEKSVKEISFTVDVATNLTENDCDKDGIEFIEAQEGSTRIRFTVYAYDNVADEGNEELRLMSVIPFQLAYAVSIHKAQGLEYDSVKVRCLIGFILFGDMNRYAQYKELEYAIAANHRNNGYATEALMAMLEYMFSERDTEVVAAWVRSFNKECVRVLEKCHFTYEGTLRKHARDRGDTLCYSVLKEEWIEHRLKMKS